MSILDLLENERGKWDESSYVPPGYQLNRLYRFSDLYKEIIGKDVPRSTASRRKGLQTKLKDINKIHSGLFVLYGCSHGSVGNLENVRLPIIERWWQSIRHPDHLVQWARTFCNEEGIDYFDPDIVSDKVVQDDRGDDVLVSENPRFVNELTASDHALSPLSPNYPTKIRQSTFPQRDAFAIINAPLEGVAKVFTEYMCRAIRRVRVESSWKAAITMEFPRFALVDCVMMLEVYPSEVDYLVKDLFGIEVETVRGVRHLLIGQGVRLTSNTSNPEITLKGVLDQKVTERFGSVIYSALEASAMYEQELHERKTPVTECVSMIFTSRSEEGAYINLCLDLKGGLEIRDKLYS